MRLTTARSAMRAPGGSWPEMINARSSLYTRETLSVRCGVRAGAAPVAGNWCRPFRRARVESLEPAAREAGDDTAANLREPVLRCKQLRYSAAVHHHDCTDSHSGAEGTIPRY